MAQALDSFMRRFHRAVGSRSTEIRMTLQEANELAAEINTLLTRLADRTAQTPASPTASIVMDGGSLKDLT